MTIAYERVGAGPPLVLIHPLGADRHVWRPVLERLSVERDCIALDAPGFGESDPLTGDAHPRMLAASIAAFLTSRLGIERGSAHYAGNSLGGWIALEAALAGDAATVTAIAPAGLWRRPLPRKPEVARRLAKLSSPLLPAVLRSAVGRRALLAGAVAHPERVPAADAVAFVRAYARAQGFSAVNREMRANTFTGLADIDVPVTLVWPEHDRVVTRARRVPQRVRQIDLPGCGHVPMWDDPDAVAQALLDGSTRGAVAAAGATGAAGAVQPGWARGGA